VDTQVGRPAGVDTSSSVLDRIGTLAWVVPFAVLVAATAVFAVGQIALALFAFAFVIGWSQLPGL
jgi:hypothetical protein